MNHVVQSYNVQSSNINNYTGRQDISQALGELMVSELSKIVGAAVVIINTGIKSEALKATYCKCRYFHMYKVSQIY